MKILLVNDDGIEAEGLMHLVRWARGLGEVSVCAPKTQQSGTSQAIIFDRPLEVEPFTLPYAPDIPAWRVGSTPADCIRIAYYLLGLRPDIVFSGINKGLNMGEDISYSGTCGALFEAAYEGIPGVAFSTDPHSFSWAVRSLDRVWNFLTNPPSGKSLLELARLYNVNIPADPDERICLTRQGGPYYKDRYEPVGENLYQAVGYSACPNNGDLSVDTDAVLSGFISVTPLTTAHTDEAAYRLALSEI